MCRQYKADFLSNNLLYIYIKAKVYCRNKASGKKAVKPKPTEEILVLLPDPVLPPRKLLSKGDVIKSTAPPLSLNDISFHL